MDLQEELKRHAERCDPDLRERRSNRDRRNLKKFDYSKTKDYPKFKLEMSFDDFEKNIDFFLYDLLGREWDKYDMTDKEKQGLVLSRMIDDEGKSKLKSMGIKKDKLKDNFESLL